MEGIRKEMRPRGFQIITSTIARPNKQHAVLRGFELGSEDAAQPIELAQDLGTADHRHRGDGDADLAAHATQHDDGEHNGAFHEGEGSRTNEALARGEERRRRSRRSPHRWQKP